MADGGGHVAVPLSRVGATHLASLGDLIAHAVRRIPCSRLWIIPPASWLLQDWELLRTSLLHVYSEGATLFPRLELLVVVHDDPFLRLPDDAVLAVVPGVCLNQQQLATLNQQRVLAGKSALGVQQLAASIDEVFSLDAAQRISAAPAPAPQDIIPWLMYPQLVFGGTFDHLHAGHRFMINVAVLRCSGQLLIGVTGQELLVAKKMAQFLESIEVREAAVRSTIDALRPSLELRIRVIQDPRGVAHKLPDLQAIVVSQETVPGAVRINADREVAGMAPLELIVIEHVQAGQLDSMFGETKLSSTSFRRIVAGESAE